MPTEDFKAAARRYRLSAEQLDKEIIYALNRMGNMVVADAKRNTPVDTGHMRRNWKLVPAKKEGDAIVAYVVNQVEYSFYVNYGHRSGAGWTQGKFMLERAMQKVMGSSSAEMEARIHKLIETGRGSGGGGGVPTT